MSLWSDRGVLDRCFELQKYEVVFPLVPGAHVARGFADVGYEEFCLLPNDRLVSLFTGSITELREEERRFFFVVPAVDMVRDELDRRGWDIVRLECPERRGWIIEVYHELSENRCEARGTSILETVLEALMKIIIDFR